MNEVIQKLKLRPVEQENCEIASFPTQKDFEAIYIDGGWEAVQELSRRLVELGMGKALDWAIDGELT